MLHELKAIHSTCRHAYTCNTVQLIGPATERVAIAAHIWFNIGFNLKIFSLQLKTERDIQAYHG